MLLWYNISFIKRILKRLCCYRRNEGLIIIIVKFRVETFFTGFCYAPSIHLRGTLYLAQKWLAMLIWKWKGLHIWFMISEKSITRCTFLHCSVHINQKFQQVMKKFCPKISISFSRLPSCELVVFIDMNANILTGRQEFQNILGKKLCNCFGKLLLIY